MSHLSVTSFKCLFFRKQFLRFVGSGRRSIGEQTVELRTAWLDLLLALRTFTYSSNPPARGVNPARVWLETLRERVFAYHPTAHYTHRENLILEPA